MKTSIPAVLILFATLTSSGCVVIEKKTLVMIIPPESNEIHLCYVFEGISVDGGRGSLAQAKSDLDNLKKNDFSFFMSGTAKDNPVLQHCRFEKLRFFVDPERKRPLCADRRMTIVNREEFEKILNKSISESLAEAFRQLDEKEIQAEIKKANDELRRESTRRSANVFGMGPLIKTWEGLVEIGDGFDLASIKQVKAAAMGGFRWMRFEADTVHLVLPATAECAKRIAKNPVSKDWLKEMRRFVAPIDLEPRADGLAIVLGKKGQVIRLTYADTRPHSAFYEQALAKYAGSPESIILDDGNTANADRLIQRFLAEKTKKR
jgi:hypothetical protein